MTPTSVTPAHTGRDTPARAGTRSWTGVAAVMFAVAWGGNQFTPLLSVYEQRSGFAHVTVTLLLFAYVIGLAPSLLASGPLATRVGPRPLLMTALGGSAVGSALIAVGEHQPGLIFIGRLLIGLALGVGMVVGGSTLTRIALADSTTRPGTGARRSAMSVTAGFGIGAAAAGVIAQWAPAPARLPYVAHLAVCAAAVALFIRTPHLPRPSASAGRAPFGAVPAAFIWQVMPAAPLIFGALGVAYAVLPSFVAQEVAQLRTGFAALLCLLSLGLGFLAQQLVGSRLPAHRRGAVRPIGVGLIIAGIVSAAGIQARPSVTLVIVTVVVMGIGYGLVMIGCLLTVERVATPPQLPILTGITYTLAYLGFGLPTVLAWLNADLGIGYRSSLLWVAAIATVAVTGGALIHRVRRPQSTSC